MNHRRIFWLILGLALAIVPALATIQPSEAHPNADSSCMTCHEVEGNNPVKEQGDWHIQHTVSDMCVACHGGNAGAADQEQAHAGTIKNPLTQAEQNCSLCHPDDWSDRAAQYAALITPEAATDTPVPTDTPAPPVVTTAPAQGEEPQSGIPAATEPPVATATEAPSSTPEPTAAPAAATTGETSGGATGGWFGALRFARGPLFKACLWVFAIGMLLRLFQVLRLGWRRTHPLAGNRPVGIAKSFLKGVFIWPFLPTLKGTFRRTWVMYVAGGLFHLGLFGSAFFSKTHMQAWKTVLGFGWPTLPKEAVMVLSSLGLLAMLALLLNRLTNPLLRLISGTGEWLNWAFVFLPMLTGFILARRLVGSYEMMFTIHMLLVDFLLVWIPLSRISHFMFYFLSRSIRGVEFDGRVTT